MDGWRKSTHCNGGQCVEVASWRKSTHSGVGVRDSALEGSPVLEFPADSWRAFVASLRLGA